MVRPRGHARQLYDAAIDSLVVAVELYNRPSEIGRPQAVIMLLQHSHEMLLKSIILRTRGRIRASRDTYNYSFKKCVNIAESELKMLAPGEAIQLRALEHHRDSATHDVLVLPENLLYYTVHGAFHVATALASRAYQEDLVGYLPKRALPVAAEMPQDLASVLQTSVNTARNLLSSGQRRGSEARGIVRALANIEAALSGRVERPTDSEIAGLSRKLKSGIDLPTVFPQVAGLTLAGPDAVRDAIFVGVRVSKEGSPVRFAEPGEDASLIRPVNDFEIWPYTSVGLSKVLGITAPRVRALADHLALKGNLAYHKMVRHQDGKLRSRYTPATVRLMEQQLGSVDLDAIWDDYRQRGGN